MYNEPKFLKNFCVKGKLNMKKTVIGIATFFGGIGICLSIVSAAIGYLPFLEAWSGSYSSKLFFLIFSGLSHFDDGADGLGLGIFFIFGVTLMLLGLAVLAIEYFKKK